MAVLSHRTSQCNGCLPLCLSLCPIDVLIENDRSANNIDTVSERSLRQIPFVYSGPGKNDANLALIHLQGLLLKI